MKYRFLLLLIFSISLFACKDKNTDENTVNEYVNPFIGTGGHGHTFPGATVPFGMVQLSPDTYNAGWDWCSGYHDTDTSIMGFSHTHLSGTGRGDLLDILMMPTVGKIHFDAGTRANPDSGYRSRFSHQSEVAEPGYYRVYLKDYNINAELTATTRAGFQRFTFDKSGTANLVVDMAHSMKSDSIYDGYLKIVGDTMIVGSHKSHGWGEDHEKYWVNNQIFFAAKISQPILKESFYSDGKVVDNVSEIKGRLVKANLIFNIKHQKPLLVKVGISSVSIKNALKNLDTEIPDWNFNSVRKKAQERWTDLLNTIQIDDTNKVKKEIFYTALYHSCIAPYTSSDVDNRYMGFDGRIHQTKGFTMLTGLSLWDTYRAANPLYTLIAPKTVNNIIHSMLAQYDQYGLLPVWPLYSCETNCMIGFHSVPVIVDAYFKGFHDFDVQKAYEAMKHSAMQDGFGIKYFNKYNYVPSDLENKSVSKTLEYAFDDWCLARLAKALGKNDDYEYFMKKSQAYRNVFDPATRFMRGRNADGTFVKNFDPTYSSYGYSDFIEGNSWQYTWYVPQDVNGLISLMGGEKSFTQKLDSLFLVSVPKTGNEPVDISGMLGEYSQGNEPSHHIAYLYSLAGQPWKTEEKIHQICSEFYSDKNDGLCGNEDMGQMSAWYVFSALGFYPVNPASGEYVLGTPAFHKVVITLPNGKKLLIEARNFSPGNYYVDSVYLNGRVLKNGVITHEQLLKGGSLVFFMSQTPRNN